MSNKSTFTYTCINPECVKFNNTLSYREILENRKCASCGKDTHDINLFDGLLSCVHEEDEHNFSGIKCKKCNGWFCF